jgi:hypothetical protein
MLIGGAERFEFAFLSQVQPVLSHLQKLGSRVRVSAFDSGFNALGCGNSKRRFVSNHGQFSFLRRLPDFAA